MVIHFRFRSPRTQARIDGFTMIRVSIGAGGRKFQGGTNVRGYDNYALPKCIVGST
jgi:hypothetical protein